MPKPWWTQNKDLCEEIITLRKEIVALRWVIYHWVSGVWPKDERNGYCGEIWKFQEKTKELEGEI